MDGRARTAFATASPHNIVHLSKPQPDHDRYAHAASQLRSWLAGGILWRHSTPALYVYEHVTSAATAVGLVGAVNLDGPVFPHEDVVPAVVADRVALMVATRAQFEPILLTYHGNGAASDVVDTVTATPPWQEVILADERHRIWPIHDPATTAVIADDLATRSVLIADGHHRFAAYCAVHAQAPMAGTGSGLAVLVDAARHPLDLRGIHRSVAGLPYEDAIVRVADAFSVVALKPDDDLDATLAGEKHTAFVIGDENHRTLIRRTEVNGSHRIDAAVLTDVLLTRLWKVDDTDMRVVHHHRYADALRRASRHAGVAVIVRPPTLSDVLDVAARGERMPRKSTSFGPKPWTGLIMRGNDYY
jgi:uncharacterized protein (DUF1015 family)